jgi:predicted DNA-binding antitoxin AbrB/MazE fold protein
MNQEIEAIYEGGVFRPITPVELPEHQLVVVLLPDGPANQDQSSFWRELQVDELARQQSVNPFKFDPSRESSWPEDESIDEFIAAVRHWRSGEE